MKFIKSKLFYFLIGVILSGSMVYAATTISASQITYTDKNNVERTVDVVLDDLYDKANSERVATEVATITTATRANTYTMQNDGYITGTVARSYERNDYWGATVIFTKDSISNNVVNVPYNYADVTAASLYAPKGTTISVRTDGGTYNLTVYEWK